MSSDDADLMRAFLIDSRENRRGVSLEVYCLRLLTCTRALSMFTSHLIEATRDIELDEVICD